MANVAITWRPLTQWPAGRPRTPSSDRRRSTFRAVLSATLELLDRELWSIGVRNNVYVQVDTVSERDFRNDGYIRADAQVKSPAIVLSFTSINRVPLVFASDYFTEWDDNLRAIALGLEGLRRLDRYHIGQSGDQYRGWAALPATTTPAFNVEQAASFLAKVTPYAASDIIGSVALSTKAIRAAAALMHPDVGGSTGNFQLVQEAKRVLSNHHGVAL